MKKKIYADGVEGSPARVGDMVCAENPASLNQVVGQLVAIESDVGGTEWTLYLDGGTEMTIWEPDGSASPWRIKKIHEDASWHPRNSTAIELRQRYLAVSGELMNIRQELGLSLYMGATPETLLETARNVYGWLEDLEGGLRDNLPEGWRDQYMRNVEAGWD